MEENGTKKTNPQESVYISCEKRANDIRSKKNIVWYCSVFLINICTLLLAWVFINNKWETISVKEVFADINWKYILFILLIIVICFLLKSFISFLSLRKHCKSAKFKAVFLANSRRRFYEMVTIYNQCDVVYSVGLCVSGVDKCSSIEHDYSGKVLSRLSRLLYSFVFMIIGAVFYFTKVNVWVFIAGIVAFFINCMYVLLIVLFDFNRDKTIGLVAKFSKILYKLKLINDYQLFFQNVTNQLFAYSMGLKKVKKLSYVIIVSNLIVHFIRNFILFVIFQGVDIVGYSILCEVLFKCAMIDLIVSVLPLPKGMFVYEVLFITLFRGVVTSASMLCGMILYRFFDYLINFLVCPIIMLCDRNKNTSKDVDVIVE